MSEQTARLVARLRSRLQRTTRRITWAEVAFGIAVAIGSVAGAWLLAALLEASLWLGTTARTALATAVGTVAVGVVAVVLARPLGRLVGLLPGPSDEEMARRVGQHYPSVADRLVNLLQLAEGKRTHAPAPLVDHAVQDLANDLDDVSFEAIEDFGRARQATRLASLPLAGVLAFLLIAPSTFLGASERLLAPDTEFDRPAPFQLSVAPGDAHLVRGDSLQLTVRATGTPPSTVTLQMRDGPSDAIERFSLQADSASTFRHDLSTVRESFQYRIDAPPLRTEWYDVTVTNRPLVRELQVTVSPPSYTGLPSRELDPNVGDVTGLPGSRVTVEAAVGGPPVKAARLKFDDGTTRPIDVSDGTARGTFSLRREGTYYVRLESSDGITNRDPIQYQVSLQPDARPSVSFLQPQSTADLGDDLTQQLRVKLSDDFGFSQVKLYFRLAEQRFGDDQEDFSSISLPLPNTDKTSLELAHKWLLAQESGLDPEPGDVIAYYVKAWDNDTVNGPKSGRTATQRLRRPSLSEQYEELDETQSEAGEQMKQLQQRSDSARQQFRQLRDELRRTREADWQDRQKLDRIQKKQESVEKGAEKLSETVQKMNRQMQKNGLSSPETMKKFKELQRVIEETKSPELQKALDKLRKAMQNNNLQQMQEAMEQVQKNEKSYQKQLERTLSLFKQLKAQQKLGEMSRRAKELSETEKKLREKTRERMKESASDKNAEEEKENGNAPSDSAATDNSDSSEQPSENEESSKGEESSEGEESSKGEQSSKDEQSSEGQTSSSNQNSQSARSDSSGTTDQKPSRNSNADSSKTPGKKSQNEDLAREQERAAEKMKKLMEEMEKAESEMNDVQSAPKKQMQKMKKQMQRQNLPKQMRKNSQQLRQNQMQDAQQGQKQMQQRLQRMQKQLSQMKSNMQGRQRQINVVGLRSALENTLWLSKEQESLRLTVSGLASQGPTLRSYAREQKTLSDGLKTVADSLESIASRVPQMSQKVQEKTGNALRAMETATTALDERKSGKATGHQKTSMKHLNELALLLSELLEKLQNQQGSGSGMSMQQMMQKLQQMSGQQQKLNKQIQKHLNNVQGERLSKEEAQRQKELAKQQRQIKKQLEDMDVGSEARKQIMGDLKKIEEQMEKTADQLEQGRHSRDLVEQQKQILTRLLNAQKSLRTQGKEKQRRGQEAEDEYEQRPPGALPDTEKADQLRRDFIRALEMGYSPDYEELIKRYFELLQQQQEKKSTP